MDINSAWQDILSKLRTHCEITQIAYDIYISKATPCAESGNTLILSVPLTSYQRELSVRFRDQIMDAMRECGSPYTDYNVILESEKDEYCRADIKEEEAVASTGTLPFVKEYTFDNFVVGDSNRFAYAAASAVAEDPGNTYNPMFIYSRAGLGKTHLLNAIGNTILARSPETKVLYITAENFTNDYIYAIRNNKNADVMHNFNTKYRTQDVLMIDDVQFFEKAEKSQEALFHIFNDLYMSNRQIILSSDRPIRNLTFLDERLASRFASGISVDISAPTLEDRIAILQKKAQNYKMNIGNEVLYYLADAERNNIRTLDGMLRTVRLYAKLNNMDVIGLEAAELALRDSVSKQDDTITIQGVVNACCEYFHIKPEDITGKRRNKEFVVPRQYAMYIITVLLPSTPLVAIGEYFGRDHSTVISARDKIGTMLQTDEQAKRIAEDLKNMVLNK